MIITRYVICQLHEALYIIVFTGNHWSIEIVSTQTMCIHFKMCLIIKRKRKQMIFWFLNVLISKYINNYDLFSHWMYMNTLSPLYMYLNANWLEYYISKYKLKRPWFCPLVLTWRLKKSRRRTQNYDVNVCLCIYSFHPFASVICS